MCDVVNNSNIDCLQINTTDIYVNSDNYMIYDLYRIALKAVDIPTLIQEG